MECVKCALAADLLGKGFSMWRTHIVDVTGNPSSFTNRHNLSPYLMDVARFVGMVNGS
jgi:hypothetical protein